MSRLCSFEIRYKNGAYPTLVSVLHHDNDVVCRVHFVEKKLRYVVPGDVLIYNQQEGLKQPQNIPPELTRELQRCICESALDKT
jgi:hypothetical protein